MHAALPALRLLLALLLPCLLTAMTVLPSSFDDLVTRADTIVRSEVLSLRCEARGSGQGRHIVTLVRIRIERCLAGEAPDEMELELLGGRVGDEAMVVSGQPVFHPGDRDILFVQANTRTICPVAGVNYGRFWLVSSDKGGPELVARADGTPLHATEEIHSPLGEAPASRLAPPPSQSGAPVAATTAILDRETFEQRILSRRAELKPAATANR